jgi:hypothetical protein
MSAISTYGPTFQIAAGFRLLLLPLRSPDKAEPMRLDADPSDFEPAPRPVPKEAGLAFIERRLRPERQRTRDASRYGVEVNFGNYRILSSGRESAPYRVKGTLTKIRARAFSWHIFTDQYTASKTHRLRVVC